MLLEATFSDEERSVLKEGLSIKGLSILLQRGFAKVEEEFQPEEVEEAV